ncbi:MAG: peptidylprolyl isomerase [Anaerolineales bacterium]|nr:peptidylprolyl isomerase [Anaerolineales bacterium]
MPKAQKTPVLSRKQLSGLSKERDLNRLILIGTGVLVGLVLLLVGWTWLLDAVIHPGRVVAVVEGVEIKGSQFITRTRLNRQQFINSYYQTYNEYLQMAQFFGDNPMVQQQYFTSLLQIEQQLDVEYMGEYSINQLVNEELLKLAAVELGIEIDGAAFDKGLEELFGFYPDGTPTPPTIPTLQPTSTLSALQQSLVTPVPTIQLEGEDGELDPEVTPSATANPTDLPTPTEGPSLTPFPTATTYTRESYQENLALYYSSWEELDISQADLEAVLHSILLRNAIRDHITADLPRTQEQVWARHILTPSLQDAEAALARLADGEDWTDLAAELSIDTGSAIQGGDLGWFARGVMVEPFSNAAFELGIGEISDPVESQFGWHIIQVLGHEDRAMGENEYEQLREQTVADYIEQLRQRYEWHIDESWRDMTPDRPRLQGSVLGG